ncbi:MAG TPA: glycosyl hydrolase family 18 protein [Solirubrobacter sp.]|nr:glycosyl hydrolase family 18 protein [Solirubrobacter sp.]
MIAAALAAAALTCPAHVDAVPDPLGTTATVTWRAPKQARLAFRVARDGATIGQTRGRRLRVRVAPDKRHRITVTPVLGDAVQRRCARRVTVGGPLAVRGFMARPSGKRVRLSWEPAGNGRYRLWRGARPRALRTRSATARIPARGSARYRVAAAGGPRSAPVIVKRGHRAPKPPSRPTLAGSTLSWRRAPGKRLTYRVRSSGRTVKALRGTRTQIAQPGRYEVLAVDALGWASKAVPVPSAAALRAPGAPRAVSVSDTTLALAWDPPSGATPRGYRVLRDGQVVGQVAAPRIALTNLAPKATHAWSVVAVDGRGRVSAPSPETRITQADPPPATGHVHAYVLASTDASFAAFRAHYTAISHVYPTYFDCNRSSAALEGRDDPLIDRFAQDRKIRLMPRVNCQSTAILQRILNDAPTRTAWLDGIAALVDQHGYDGVNIDFEAMRPEDRDAFTAFIADLAQRLHARGKQLSVAVNGKTADVPNHPRSTAFDYAALSEQADYLFVMGWGVHWSGSAPGAQDDVAWVRAVADYVATMPHREKWVMGTLLYGMDWPAGGPGTALHYADIQALGQPATYMPEQDSYRMTYTDAAGTAHELWFSDAGVVGNRVAIARERGLGVGFWRLGQEDERIWSDPRLP